MDQARTIKPFTPGPHEKLGAVTLGGFQWTVVGRRLNEEESITTAYVNLDRDVPLYCAAPDLVAAAELMLKSNMLGTNEPSVIISRASYDALHAAYLKATHSEPGSPVVSETKNEIGSNSEPC